MGFDAWESLAVAVVGALGGVLAALAAGWLSRRKTDAEAGQAIACGADELVGSALLIVKEMRTDMDALKARVQELEAENDNLRAVVEEQGRVIEEQGRVIGQLEAELARYREAADDGAVPNKGSVAQ